MNPEGGKGHRRNDSEDCGPDSERGSLESYPINAVAVIPSVVYLYIH